MDAQSEAIAASKEEQEAFTERKASWLELFFDLAYVAAIAQLTYLLIESAGTITEYLQFILLFTMVFYSWMGAVIYKNIQGGDGDRYEQLATILQMFFALVMSVFLQGAFEAGAVGFIIGYVGTRAIMTGLIARSYKLHPERKPKSNHVLLGYRLANFFWLATLFIPQPFQGVLWAVLLLYEFLIPHTTNRKVVNTTRIINRFHLPERLGLFTILVMGESLIVVAVVNNIAEQSFTWAAGAIATASFIIMSSLWWIYFNHVEKFGAGKKFNLFGYINSHIPILVGVMFIAVATKVGMLDKAYGLDPLWLATAGIAITIIGFNGLKIATGTRTPRIFYPSFILFATLFLGSFLHNFSFVLAMYILVVVFLLFSYFEIKEFGSRKIKRFAAARLI